MKKKVLAVASAGGHWIELMRLRPAFSHHKVSYLTTNKKMVINNYKLTIITVTDANIWRKYSLLKLSFEVLIVVLKIRPDVIITTGAAPGFFAILFGKLLRAKTIWIDSIANSEELSLAGRRIGRWADWWLTQWPSLTSSKGPFFIGSVL